MIEPAKLIAYEAGTLSEDERLQVEAALASDDESLRCWTAQRQMDEMLRAAHGKPESRAHLHRSIMEVVSGGSRDEVKRNILQMVPPLCPRRRALLALAGITAAAACIILGMWLFADRGIATVIISAECTVERAGAMRPAAQGSALHADDAVIVADSPAASLTVGYRDATRLVLGPKSRVSFALDEHGGKLVTLSEGAITAQVSKQPSDMPMIVRTPQAVLTVVGTAFVVAAGTAQTRLDVTEGLVRMARADGSDAVEVAAGQSAVFLPGMIHPPAPLPGDARGLGVNAATGRRLAFMRPFAADSMWNRALGTSARYESVQPPGFAGHVQPANAITGRPIFMEVMNFPIRRVLVGDREMGSVRFADKVQPGFATAWPVVVIVDPKAARVVELRGADRLPGSDLTANAFHSSPLHGAGDHGLTASGVSALGGVLRYGELTRGVPHALALGVRKEALAGNFQLGTWLAIPPSVDITAFKGAELELAKALRDYGACVTDTCAGPFTFYAWYENVPADFSVFASRLMPLLQVVRDRDAGPPRRPDAPPIDDER